MAVLTSEAVVLRTWPVNEADLIVSFFTRDYGRLKGIAKAALKSRKRKQLRKERSRARAAIDSATADWEREQYPVLAVNALRALVVASPDYHTC